MMRTTMHADDHADGRPGMRTDERFLSENRKNETKAAVNDAEEIR